MHFQTVFGIDVFEKISERQYRRWLKYFEYFGPIWWKRDDWNFANLTSMTSASVYRKPLGIKETMLKFKRVKRDSLDNTVALVGAFNMLPQDELNELREAAEIY